MVCSKSQSFLFCILLILCTANYMVTSEEGCYQYRRKSNVTIDTDQCLWKNYTETIQKRFCLDICFENNTCTGVAMTNEPVILQCCFLYRENFRYRTPGEEVIYHRKEAELHCKKGWAGRNCDSCVKNFGPPGNCSRCSTGWTGDNCDSCAPNFEPPENCSSCSTGWTGDNCDSCAPNFEPAGQCNKCQEGSAGDNCDACAPGWLPPDCSTCRFGFSPESNCTECIQNGLWEGTVDGKDLRVWLTFTGHTCSVVAPGTQFIAGDADISVTGGTVDQENSVLNFTESAGWVYVGTITKDKRVNGTATDSNFVHYFNMDYNN